MGKWTRKALLVVFHSALIVVGIDIVIGSGKSLVRVVKE